MSIWLLCVLWPPYRRRWLAWRERVRVSAAAEQARQHAEARQRILDVAHQALGRAER